MTKLLEEALHRVRALPPDTQDRVPAAMLELVESAEQAVPIHERHLKAVLQGVEQARRGEFAADEEIEAAYRQFDQ